MNTHHLLREIMTTVSSAGAAALAWLEARKSDTEKSVSAEFFAAHGGLDELPAGKVPAAVALSFQAWRELGATLRLRLTLRPLMIEILKLAARRRDSLRRRAREQKSSGSLSGGARAELERAELGHETMREAFATAATALASATDTDLVQNPLALCPLCQAPPEKQHPECRGSGHVWDPEARTFKACPHAPERQASLGSPKETKPCVG